MVPNSKSVTAWKSKGIHNGKTKPPATSDNSLNPGITYTDNAKI